MTRPAPFGCAATLSPHWRSTLKALITGLCALVVLLTLTTAAAASVTAAEEKLERRLVTHSKTLHKSQSAVRFFRSHRWLLSDPRHATRANRLLETGLAKVAVTKRRIAKDRAALKRLRQVRMLAAVKNRTPREVICDVFGRYCDQALQVARCESNFRTTAQNGQYLGLFQMGSSERALFGHGASAEAQARAAWRYFVRSGRDWSPWSCKPW